MEESPTPKAKQKYIWQEMDVSYEPRPNVFGSWLTTLTHKIPKRPLWMSETVAKGRDSLLILQQQSFKTSTLFRFIFITI